MDRLTELDLLIAIADTGSMAQAGRRTGRSAPTVTRILAEMERRLGLRLVERTTRRLALTEAGARLAEHARRLLADFDEAMQDVAGEGARPRGRLRLSAPLVFGSRHFAPLVTEFLAAYPEVTAELSLEDRVVDLVEERIDIAVRIAHLESSTMIARRVGWVSRVCVASPAYAARHGLPARPEDLKAHQAIVHRHGPDWTFQDADGEERTIRVAGRFHVDRAEPAIEAARAGEGILRALSYQVARDLAAGRLLRLLQAFEPPPIPVQLVLPSRRLMAPRVRAFLDFAAPRLAALPEITPDPAA